MTLDPTSDLFKRAVEIAGMPDYDAQMPLEFSVGEISKFVVRGDIDIEDDGRVVLDTNVLPDTVALALLEHHFRAWLEAKCCDVFICPDCTYQCTQMETGESKAEAPTYIECQMKAIVEIREADRRDLGKRLAEMDSDGTIEGA